MIILKKILFCCVIAAVFSVGTVKALANENKPTNIAAADQNGQPAAADVISKKCDFIVGW
ncbi:hypothetical protein [Niallia sp. 03190]|uniref:hypothetical protein n=1 Tax=Niallia sp. 03190 TaxID=3458061 RepID=UPI0040443F44